MCKNIVDKNAPKPLIVYRELTVEFVVVYGWCGMHICRSNALVSKSLILKAWIFIVTDHLIFLPRGDTEET